MSGTLAVTGVIVMALKQLKQSFLVIQGGRYEARTLKTTEVPKFTAPFELKIVLSGIAFTHLLG